MIDNGHNSEGDIFISPSRLISALGEQSWSPIWTIWYSVNCMRMTGTNQRTKSTAVTKNRHGNRLETESQREAEECVESIMSSQPVPAASTSEGTSEGASPLTCRKRNLSELVYTGMKKAKSDRQRNEDNEATRHDTCTYRDDYDDAQEQGVSDGESEAQNIHPTGRVIANARRSLYGRTPAQEKIRDGNIKHSEIAVSSDNISAIMLSLQNISSELKVVNTTLSERISLEVKKVNESVSVSKRINKLETDLDKRLSDRLAQMVDKQMNSEVKMIRTEVDNRMGNIRSDLTSEIEEIGAKVNSIIDTLQADMDVPDSQNRHLKVIVRNFPESVNEYIEDRMKSLIRSHIEVDDVTVSAANRIESNLDRKPGMSLF